MKKSNKRALIVWVAIAAICAGVGSYSFARYSNERKEVQNLTEESVQEYLVQEKKSEEIEVKTDENQKESSTEKSTSMVIDFDKLQKTNPDIIAWINIPDTDIDYPIAQHPKDDGYYLKHGMNGMASSHGCPYIELSDSGSFMEFNTVVYGHNMKDGSMFAGLHKFEDKTFFDSHREIDVYTKDHTFKYKVFGAVMYSDAHIPYYYNDKFESDRTAFLKSLSKDSIADRSILPGDVTVTEDNYIITLSTCDAVLRSNRFLVVGVLTEIDGQSVK